VTFAPTVKVKDLSQKPTPISKPSSLSELSVQQMRASSWRLVPAGVTGGTEGLGVAVGVGDGVDVAAGVGVVLRLDAAAPEGEAARSVIARIANAATAERGLIACLT